MSEWLIELCLEHRRTVAENAARVAKLGNWPGYIDPLASLVERVPNEPGKKFPGFDAGIACALGLIPEDKQKLAATLHAAYTEEAVEQVRREVVELVGGSRVMSETVYWLYGCACCSEEQDVKDFMRAVERFRSATTHFPYTAVLNASRREWEEMQKSFMVSSELAIATKDGGMQAAYVAGHDLACQLHPGGFWFLGTFRESLGLEAFPWSDAEDDEGRPISGPVHGSKQFVKCATLEELGRAVQRAREVL